MLVLALAGPEAALAQVSTPTAGEDTVYRDPQGRFTIPIPTNWIAEEHEGYVTVGTDDKKIGISLVLISGVGASDAITQAMKLIDPSSNATPLPELMATPTSGSDDVALFTYDDGSASGQLVQALRPARGRCRVRARPPGRSGSGRVAAGAGRQGAVWDPGLS